VTNLDPQFRKELRDLIDHFLAVAGGAQRIRDGASRDIFRSMQAEYPGVQRHQLPVTLDRGGDVSQTSYFGQSASLTPQRDN
jgi:hypothetical protein